VNYIEGFWAGAINTGHVSLTFRLKSMK